jgi:hypothetical protein
MCLQSILAAHLEDIEIVVVDDGSTDETAAIVRSLGADIQYIARENGGPSAARNTGIRASRGRYVAFFDSDDLMLRGMRHECVKWLDANPDISVVFMDAYVESSGARSRAFAADQRRLSRLWAVPSVERGQFRVFDREAFFAAMVLDKCYLIPSLAIVRRSALEAEACFDERLRGYEEWDLFARLAAKHAFAFVQEPGAIIVKHDSNLSGDLEAMDMQGTSILQKFLAGAIPLSPEQRKGVEEKLVATMFNVSHAAFQRGDHRTARTRFRSLIARGGLRPAYGAYWCATWLTPQQMHRLRNIREQLTLRRSAR